MPTSKESRDFAEYVMPSDALDLAIEWIQKNMSPEDIFSEDKLEAWADENGFEVKQ